MKITSVATVVLAVITATCEGMTISCMSFVYVLKHCVHTGLDGHIAMVYIHVHRFESDCVNLLVLESLKIVFLGGWMSNKLSEIPEIQMPACSVFIHLEFE